MSPMGRASLSHPIFCEEFGARKYCFFAVCSCVVLLALRFVKSLEIVAPDAAGLLSLTVGTHVSLRASFFAECNKKHKHCIVGDA